MEKLNTLKKIEKDVDDGVKERSRVTRSASLRMTASSSSSSVKMTSAPSITSKGKKLTDGLHPQTASRTQPSKAAGSQQVLAKKVTFKTNLEEKCRNTASASSASANIESEEKVKTSKIHVKRSSSLPRYLNILYCTIYQICLTRASG